MTLREFVYEPKQSFATPNIVKLEQSESWERKNDAKWKRVAQDWKDVKEQLKQLEEKERYLREELINMSNGKSCFGGGIELIKITKKGNIDYSSIEMLKQIDLEQYRKAPSEYWKLTDVTS